MHCITLRRIRRSGWGPRPSFSTTFLPRGSCLLHDFPKDPTIRLRARGGGTWMPPGSPNTGFFFPSLFTSSHPNDCPGPLSLFSVVPAVQTPVSALLHALISRAPGAPGSWPPAMPGCPEGRQIRGVPAQHLPLHEGCVHHLLSMKCRFRYILWKQKWKNH